MLTEDLIKKVRELEIAMRRSVSEVFAGEYSSAFRGRGMEFSEVREYQPGDDVRTIDWNVTARQNAPYIKRFVEERELTVMLAVDLSGSGRFGSVQRIKNETAAELCGVVALAAARNNDKVGLVIFTGEVHAYVPPAKGMKHVLRLIRDLLEFDPASHEGGSKTDIAGALEYIGCVQRRRAIVFLVSDFLVPGWGVEGVPWLARASWGEKADAGKIPADRIETAMRVLSRRHDVIAACIADPRERALPPEGAGLIELEDAETGGRLVFDASSRRVRREFERLSRARADGLKERFRRLGVDHLDVTTHEPYVRALIELFRRRERRR